MVKKFHLGVYALILAPHQKIALVEKSRGPYTSLLDLPGGTMEYGEGVEDALAREVLEETGLVIPNFTIHSSLSVNFEYEQNNEPHNLFHIGIIYMARLSKIAQIAPQNLDLDVKSCRWVDIEECTPDRITPMVHQLIREFTL